MQTKITLLLCFFLLTQSCSKNNPVSKEAKISQLSIEVTQQIPTNEKVPMLLQENEATEKLVGSIERRGGFSIGFPKHSYEIDLNEDVPLANLPADDDWILNANYIDKTFLRHVLSYELFREMNKNNEASESSYVELALNGDYVGLYVLMEKLDKSSLKIDDEDDAGVIFKEPHLFRATYDGVVPQRADNFHQQTYPKIEEQDKTAFIEETRNFILTSDDANFETQISSVFDLENLIDWHLLLLISNNSDGILKNFYLYKIDAETPIRIAPWDYDHSFGRDGDNELNLNERPLNIERSILFARLLQFDWYKDQLKARWKVLNERNILSEDGLKKSVRDRSDFIKTVALRNFELWSLNSTWYYDANGFEEEVNIMLQFIALRHERLREYFNNL